MIKNGQNADQDAFNTAFVSRTADTSTTGRVALSNTTDANSGGAVTNAQRAINETFDAVGITGIGDATRKNYSSTNVVSAGDSHKTAIGKLDAGVYSAATVASGAASAAATAQSTATGAATAAASPNVSNATGTLPLTHGGTGNTTASGALNALLPSQTGNGTKVLGTDGTNATWVAQTGGGGSTDLSTATGVLAIANGGTGATTKSAAFNALSPLATKGDLHTFDGTTNAALGVGTQGQVLTVDSTAATGVKWAEPSGGGFNYVTNGSFEAGVSTVQWAKSTVTSGVVTGLPTLTSTQGTSSLALSSETTAPLRNTKSLRIAAATAWAQGDGVALGAAFTVQPEDAGKVLTYSLAYQVVTASNLNFSGLIGSQSLVLAILDVTNGVWVPVPAGAYGINGTALAGQVSCTFQTSVTVGQRYQAFLFNGGATTSGACAVLVDDVQVGPQNIGPDSRTIGAAMNTLTSTAITAGTPFKFTTISDDSSASLSAANGTFTAPVSGRYLVGFSGLAATGTGTDISVYVNGVSRVARAGSAIPGQARPAFNVQVNVNQGDVITIIPLTTTNALDTNAYASFIRIGGPAASVGDARVISFNGASTSQAVTANTQNIPATASLDRAGAWNGSAYLAPVSGDYVMTVAGQNSVAGAFFQPYLNGTLLTQQFSSYAATANAGTAGTFFFPNVKAGDLLSYRTSITGTVTANLAIFRLSGPSVVASSESVNCTFGLTTAQAVGTNAVIKYDTKVKDTHSAYSAGTGGTGLWTCPVSGQYRVSVCYTPGAANSGCYAVLNGVGVGFITNSATAGAATNGSISVPVTAGQTLGIYAAVANTLNAPNATFGYVNQFTIERTGN